MANQRSITLLPLMREPDHWIAKFTAMGGPCEVLIENTSEQLARTIADAAASTAWRIERKFSRYRRDNVVHLINTSNGRIVDVDPETARLLDYANTLTTLSEGRFDITSGVLRKVWTFDGGSRVPTQQQIAAVLSDVGWRKVTWNAAALQLQLQPGMEIDFGGIGKEYAVDTAARLVETIAPGLSCLINFGGDVAVLNRRSDGQPWLVGIESAMSPGAPEQLIHLNHGALATSGDSRRYVLSGGERYSHILDARTGWPVRGAPRSITVAANTCSQAGTATTLAMLQGAGAEEMLRTSGMKYWLQ
ncbi:MAG: FAD:protein FMN transferase [Steroidobacter sp.]